MSVAIEARDLVKRFGRTIAVNGVDLAVPAGSVVGVLGPNGAGKTTIVRMLATLLRPDSGQATVGGYDVVRDAVRVRGMIGLTGQYVSVDEVLSGTENLVLLGRLAGLSRTRARVRATELLANFELTEAASRPVRTYSGGMRRRLDLAASLVQRPRVLYLDEPTTGLDPHARGLLWQAVRALVADGVTVLLTTQYLEEADQLADRIIVVDHGRIVAQGPPEELKRRIGGQTVQVRPGNIQDSAAIACVLRDLTGAEPTCDPDSGLLTARVTDPIVVSTVVRKLDRAAIPVEELALRLPSLDEVFLALVGPTV
jgi:oleandomycin transport system ATP-binding protein